MIIKSNWGQLQKKWSSCVTWGSKIQTLYIFTMCSIVPVFYHDHRWNYDSARKAKITVLGDDFLKWPYIARRVYGLMSKKKHYTEDTSFFSEPALFQNCLLTKLECRQYIKCKNSKNVLNDSCRHLQMLYTVKGCKVNNWITLGPDAEDTCITKHCSHFFAFNWSVSQPPRL